MPYRAHKTAPPPRLRSRPKHERRKHGLRILDFDLENRPLAYWYDGLTTAEITAIGWSWSDEGDDVHTFLLNRSGRYVADDGSTHRPRATFEAFRRTLLSADVVTGHYIRKHDLPLLNAAMVENDLPPLSRILVSDTHRDTPKMKDLSKSQENLANMFGLEQPKHSMTNVQWRKANRLGKVGLEEAKKRVVNDVRQHKALRAALIERGLLKTARYWYP